MSVIFTFKEDKKDIACNLWPDSSVYISISVLVKSTPHYLYSSVDNFIGIFKSECYFLANHRYDKVYEMRE